MLTGGAVILVGVSLVLAILEERFAVIRRLSISPQWCRVTAYVLLLFVLEAFAVTGQTIPFVYFQF